MTAPLPIRTQCFKHKSGFVENEESRRYISSSPYVYIPKVFRMKPDKNIKQGSAGPMDRQGNWHLLVETQVRDAIRLYNYAIAEGMCPEQARFILPQGTEVTWIWTGSLAAFARFYDLRTASYAQEEIKQLAKEVGEIIAPLYPVSWAEITGGH
jgi:thymidylate synthase (FAD)